MKGAEKEREDPVTTALRIAGVVAIAALAAYGGSCWGSARSDRLAAEVEEVEAALAEETELSESLTERLQVLDREREREKARADSIVREARERAEAARQRASLLASELEEAVPDTLAPLVTELVEAHAQEVAGLRAQLTVRESEIRQLEARVAAGDSALAATRRALRESEALTELERERNRPGIGLPFSIRVPEWTGYVLAAGGGWYVGSEL